MSYVKNSRVVSLSVQSAMTTNSHRRVASCGLKHEKARVGLARVVSRVFSTEAITASSK